jgi:hypothetical protein
MGGVWSNRRKTQFFSVRTVESAFYVTRFCNCQTAFPFYDACRVRQYAFYACPPRGKALRGMAYGKQSETFNGFTLGCRVSLTYALDCPI